MHCRARRFVACLQRLRVWQNNDLQYGESTYRKADYGDKMLALAQSVLYTLFFAMQFFGYKKTGARRYSRHFKGFDFNDARPPPSTPGTKAHRREDRGAAGVLRAAGKGLGDGLAGRTDNTRADSQCAYVVVFSLGLR